MHKRIVIIGLGDTGLLCAVRLAGRGQVTAISTKPCMLSGQDLGLRLARPEAWRASSLIAFDRYKYLDSVDVIHGRAVAVDPHAQVVRAETAEGESRSLGYDVLLIASGVRNGFWRNGRVESLEAIEADLDRRAEGLAQARTLAVVGGGPSGVSAAANARRQRPDQAVHLFFSRTTPLPGYHPKARAEVARRLSQIGVVLHPEHRAIVPAGASTEAMTEGPILWQTGQAPFAADTVLWTLGRVQPNTDYLPPDVLDEAGFVRVDAMLRVPGWPGVYAVGDVAATDPNRSSARNQGHLTAVRNIGAYLDERPHRMRTLPTLPSYRWGSIFGLQPEGMRVYFPGGCALTFGPWLSTWLLFRVIVGQVLFRGIRRFNLRDMRWPRTPH